MNKNSTLKRLCMALLLAVLTTAVRADVVPFTESYNAESTTDGWTSSVEERFTPIIYNEADLQQGASDNYFLSVNQSELSNNGCLVTGTVLSGKAAAGDDFTLEFDMRLCNSNNNVNSQSPVSLQIKDADNDKDILSLSTPAKYVQTWNVNGTDLQVTLPGYGGQTISALTWCHYKISRSSGLTYLTITDNSTQEPILERTLIGGSSETGGLGNIVFTTKRYRSNFAIDNIVVRQLQESDVPSVEMSSYTIKYHNESGDEIAADIVTPYIVGGEATANDGQLAPIYYNDKKYLYKEGNSTITLVGDAAQNVITLVYREAQKCSYTIMGEYGDKEKVLHEGTGYEGDVVTYNYPEYILDGTTLYFKQTKTTNPHFGGTILLNEANITEYVYYTDGEASNVVYYKEAEQMDGFTPLATNNADIRCSDGMGGVIDGDEPVVLTTLPAGTYTIHGQIWGTAGYTATITAGDKTVWELTSVGWIIDATSDIFTLDEETTLYIKDSGDMDGMKMLDLIYIQEAKPQYVAEFNRVEGTLTFKKGTLSLGAATTWDAENTGSEPGWYSQRTNVKTVIFDESFADARPTSCAQWFKGATTLTTITGLEYLNTSEVTSMAEMFRNTQQLTTLDLRTFNTENVTDMNYMFYNDYRLTSLNVSSFNTANVEDMSFMFGHCSALPELDVSNLNTSKVTGMVYMFGGCSSLASLDVSKFNTSYVTNMMYMFGGCNSLTSLDVSNFNTSKVTNMGGMFNSCNSLTSLDICNFNTSNVTEMGYMFYYCSSLKTISVGEEWNTSAVTSSEGMFSNCTALVGGAGTTYDAEQTDAKYARIDGGADAPGYFTDKNATPYVKSEAYAVLSEDGQTVTFYYDTQKANRTRVVEINQNYINTYNGESNAYATATTAVFDVSFADYRPISTAYWFNGATNLTTIEGMEYINTTEVTSMSEMFNGCEKLVELDLSSFNTEKVNSMDAMFINCKRLKRIYVSSGWTTVNVHNSKYIGDPMFLGCTYLRGGNDSMYDEYRINISYARIDGGADAPGYFTDIAEKGLPYVEPYVVLAEDNTILTFYYDDKIETRNGLSYNPLEPNELPWKDYASAVEKVVFDTSFASLKGLKSTSLWFSGFEQLKTVIGLENLKTDKVDDMSWMFRHCSSLTSLDLSNFKTSNVTDMVGMFSGCSTLTSLDVSNFNTSNVTRMGSMFSRCSSLTSLDVSNFNTSNVVEMAEMFYDCSSLTSLDVSNFNTSSVTFMYSMFAGCRSLTSLDVSNFNTSNVTSMEHMFLSCSSLTSLDVSSFNTSNVMNLNWMFRNCSSLISLDLSNFNTSNVTAMDHMFSDCRFLKTIYAGEGWTTDALTDSSVMLYNCTALVGGAGTVFDANHTDAEYARIDGGTDAPGYFTAKNVTPKDNVTLTAKSYSRQYGEENPAFEYDVTEGTITDGAPELATEATATSPVGTYDIVISKGSVTNNEVSLVNGTLTITKAPLTISCGDYTIMQGEVLPEFALEYNGWKNDETEDVLTTKPTVACEASKDSEPGTYDIIVSGAEAENYEISYVAGTLTIEAKPIVIEPVEVETEMKTETLSGQDLSNNVVNDVYYNVGSDSYDASDKSIVISQPTNMAQIADKQPGSKDVKENFNGMILKVAKGKGLITVNVKTSGNAQLVVQVGNGTPMLASKTEKGDVVFRYDVEEDTYVYIYAIIGSSAAKGYGLSAADTDGSVRIYSITVSPGATGIRSISASEKNDGNIYDLQGRRVDNPAKGIYIVGGCKVSVK